MTAPVMEIKSISKRFGRPGATVHALTAVSLSLLPGETLGVVGESGCGKSTLGRVCLGLLPPNAGAVTFQGEDLYRASSATMRRLRRDFGMIFQDPFSSLNPRMRVADIITEPLLAQGELKGRADRLKRAGELLDSVGLDPAVASRFPHEFSGGQRQRIGIARALALHPKLVVCDEPVSALDVSVRAQVLQLLIDLQKQHHQSYLFISHDMSVVRHMSDRVAVLYLGQVMELAANDAFFAGPKHPYAQALIAAVPMPIPNKRRERVLLEGDPPSPLHPPSGCPFHPRCPKAIDQCSVSKPALRPVGAEHWVACHLYEE